MRLLSCSVHSGWTTTSPAPLFGDSPPLAEVETVPRSDLAASSRGWSLASFKPTRFADSARSKVSYTHRSGVPRAKTHLLNESLQADISAVLVRLLSDLFADLTNLGVSSVVQKAIREHLFKVIYEVLKAAGPMETRRQGSDHTATSKKTSQCFLPRHIDTPRPRRASFGSCQNPSGPSQSQSSPVSSI